MKANLGDRVKVDAIFLAAKDIRFCGEGTVVQLSDSRSSFPYMIRLDDPFHGLMFLAVMEDEIVKVLEPK